MSGTDDKAEGQGQELKGRLKEAAGDLTDDKSLKSEGAGDKTAGKVKQAVGDIKKAAEDIR
jgi:uncharacterized protein YjbJ (UPF0337 family)